MQIGGFNIPEGQRTHVHNANPQAWRVTLRTTGGTLVEFDVIVGGSFAITTGQDVADLRLDVQHAPGPRSVGD